MTSTRAWTLSLVLVTSTSSPATVFAAEFPWSVVVNNGTRVPADPLQRTFNSYNQPSLNVGGLVVFRGRSRGGMGGQPAHGVYTRDMARGTPVSRVFDRNTVVPQPNDLGSTFVEPPAFPRIDMGSNTIASRGNHPPVWEYLLPDGTETRAGTTGVYANPFGALTTGASNLGAVPGFESFAVPETDGIKFDVFPGAPAVTDARTIVVKGNYTDASGVSRTGVYYRDLRDDLAGGAAPMVPIADSVGTFIPGSGTVFGSTAPPSAAGRLAVFSGFDNEDSPTLGGIYLAPLNGPRPPLIPLVAIGGQVPGERRGTVFNKLGEGLSFDGRFVAFWGAWGAETRSLTLECPEDGNQALIDYCVDLYPDGFVTTVPVHQGIFVHDIRTGQTRVVAKTPTDFDDFVYWNFSGRVPGTGEGDDDGELARWRSASFVAASGLVDGNLSDANVHVAFKARRGAVVDGAYVDPVDGIYLAKRPGDPAITAVVETGMVGTRIDPAAVYDADEDPGTPPEPLPVTTMGIERDGFRGNLLAITVSMGTEEAGWAGVYLTVVPRR